MQLTAKAPHVLIVSKTNVHNDDATLINFTTYLFLCDQFSWMQLTLKFYYHRFMVCVYVTYTHTSAGTIYHDMIYIL